MIQEKTMHKIRQVASVCIRCRRCMKECIMLNDFTDCPKTLFSNCLVTGKIEKRVAYSCNECDQCTLKCPKNLDLKSVFQSLKEDYAAENQGIVPVAALLPSEAGQKKECHPDYCAVRNGAGKSQKLSSKQKTKYVFVPGCTISAYSPKAVENVVRHLKKCLGDENVGALLQCCGKVSAFMGESDKFQERNKIAIDKLENMGCEVIITVCPSCFKIFKSTAKNQKVISYWDLMYNLIGIPESARNIGKFSDVTFNIHDSCVTRDEPSHHKSIRWILDQMGYRWEEIENSGCKTRCCGVGGMVCASEPALYKRVYTRRKGDFTQEHIISYCGSCRGTFEAAEMDSLHILDLLFADHGYTAKEQHRRSCQNEAEVWERRLETRQRLIGME